MDETSERPAEVVIISRSAGVKAAAAKMLTNKIGCLIINDQNGKFAGIVTERDIVSRVVASSTDIDRITVAEIMTPQVICCSVGTATSQARQIMAANRIRHLPVVEDGVVVGILSARDLMERQLLEDRAAAEEVAMLSACLKSIDLNEAADIVAEEVPKLFQARNCVLCLYEAGSATECPALLSRSKCLCPQEHLPWLSPALDSRKAGSLAGASLSPSKRGSIEDRVSRIEDSIPDKCEKLGARSPRLVIPLAVPTSLPEDQASNKSKQLSGHLCMCGLAPSNTVNRELTSYKAKLTREILTSHLRNASLYQQARLTSLTDALTAVGSRKLLEDRLEAEAARAKRYERPFSIAIIDLDNFKTINDVLGHATGDDALRKLAACMKGQIRTPDVLARYGGDEFVILMPETKAGDAVTLLERIRTKVQEIKVAKKFSMTISCGIAQSLPDGTDSSSEVIRRADLALYDAKSAGRNCVRLWDTAACCRRCVAND